MKVSVTAFLLAFFDEDDDVCFRIFSDRKEEDPSFKGVKLTKKLKNADRLLPVLKKHNAQNRGIFFTVNAGGHADREIIRINAQFVECDTQTFEEQMENLKSFPLPPSIVAKTQKSLHSYWLMQDAEVSRFRELQLRLAEYFCGDTQCQNESRVMRIPGFYHCKKEPVEVECIIFEPERKYTQEQLAEYLPHIQVPAGSLEISGVFKGEAGSGQRLIDHCAFCRHCCDYADALSEPMWYAFITNMALTSNGVELIHQLSKPYPGYSETETDEKIRHAVTENKPHTCEYIKCRLGFTGCGKCNVKAPIVHAMLSEASPVETAIKFSGIELGPVIQPVGWNVSMNDGVRKIRKTKNGITELVVSPAPVVISKRFENIDDDTEKAELSFYRNSRWKRVLAPRSQLFNKSAIIKYADSGLPVSSDSASELVKYLSDYENINISNIALVKSISRIGWVDKQFYPYDTDNEIYFDTEFKETYDLIKSLKQKGDFMIWKHKITIGRKNHIARFLISASFASPLLVPLSHRVFFVHIWYDSKSGKTAAIKAGVSVWGNPARLMGSFNATSVGLERMAGTLKHLPFAIDELQVLNEKRMTIEHVIYSLANGFGRIRGTKEGGMQHLMTWRNIIITSGEQPLSRESSNDGVLTRVLELYGRPVSDIEFARDLHLLAENNYGFAGERFIKYITAMLKDDSEKVKRDYAVMQNEIRERMGVSSHLDNAAVVCLGDYYASISVFDYDQETAWQEAVSLGTAILDNNKQLERADAITRAWDFVTGWIIGNKARFENTAVPCYGMMDDDKCYIIPSYLREALEERGFDYSKVTRGFKERGYFEIVTDKNGVTRMHVLRKVNGVPCKVFAVRFGNMSDGPLK